MAELVLATRVRRRLRRSRPATPGAGAWALTAAATVASTFALDAVATAGGLLLAASGLLGGIEHRVLLGVLAITYVVWAAGMRVNLTANAALLARTGTSTSILSKAAHDAARRAGAGAGTRRLAASAGYVATELAKEAPYYAGAFGAVLATDSVSSSDALVFLAGTNLAAAAYEYALARATRALLRRRGGGPGAVQPGGLRARRVNSTGSASPPSRRR